MQARPIPNDREVKTKMSKLCRLSECPSLPSIFGRQGRTGQPERKILQVRNPTPKHPLPTHSGIIAQIGHSLSLCHLKQVSRLPTTENPEFLHFLKLHLGHRPLFPLLAIVFSNSFNRYFHRTKRTGKVHLGNRPFPINSAGQLVLALVHLGHRINPVQLA